MSKLFLSCPVPKLLILAGKAAWFDESLHLIKASPKISISLSYVWWREYTVVWGFVDKLKVIVRLIDWLINSLMGFNWPTIAPLPFFSCSFQMYFSCEFSFQVLTGWTKNLR